MLSTAGNAYAHTHQPAFFVLAHFARSTPSVASPPPDSTVGFAFGSPDIIPMFVEHSPHVHAEWYVPPFPQCFL